MSEHSSIEWTDATWNPVRGCTKISAGCKNCYAETFAERFRGVAGHPYEAGFDLRLVPSKLAEPLKWKEPRRIFVNSMSDLFHPDVPATYIGTVCKVMKMADWHIFQVLTKRSQRMKELLTGELGWATTLKNVWWGVSVENRKHGLPRVPHLRAVPAHTKFLSIEPLLESLGPLDLDGVSWAIVGGESGHHSRPIEEAWVEEIRKACRIQNVPFFFKQWGGTRKSEAGRLLKGREHNGMPEFQFGTAPENNLRLQLINQVNAQWPNPTLAVNKLK